MELYPIHIPAGNDTQFQYNDGGKFGGASATYNKATGVVSIPGIGDGGRTNYDLKIGDTSTPDYGMIQFGNAVIGRTSYKAGNIDLDGSILFQNIGGPVTSEVEFCFAVSTGASTRFALAKPGVGNASYHSRSMLLAGPAPADTDYVKVSYWQGQGIFDNLPCDTVGSGADLGVQGSLEVERNIFCDSFKESTSGGGIVVQPLADSTTFFQIKNAAGNSVVDIDTTNKGILVAEDGWIGLSPTTQRLVFDGTQTQFRYEGLNILMGEADGSVARTFSIFQGPNGTAGRTVSFRADFDHFFLTNAFGAIIVQNGDTEGKSLRLQESGAPFSSVRTWYDGAAQGSTGWQFKANGAGAIGDITFKLGDNDGTSSFLIKDSSGNVRLAVSDSGLAELIGGAPAITLHNTTHEDSDGGGEVRIIGKREDGAGTETAAGQIEISHDGAGANDQLGKIIESVNTGAGLVAARMIQSTTDWVINKTSGVGIKVDLATPTFGFADLLGDQFSKNTGGTKPTLVTYNGAVDAWQFSNGDEAFLTYHIPHDYVPGTDIHLHVHWSQNNAGATGGTIDFKYFAIYAKGHNQVSGSAFTSTPITATFSSIDINDGGSGLLQYQQHLTEVTISAATATAALFDRDDFEPDGVIELTLEMDATNLTGTPSDPFIHYADIHYQTNGIIGTKNRTPDFYT